MPKFSANLTMLFNAVDFLGRFARAQRVGFIAVEYCFPMIGRRSNSLKCWRSMMISKFGIIFRQATGQQGSGRR